MAEELDKSEQATPYRLDEARKKGQIGRSQELVAVATFAVLLLSLLLLLTDITSTLALHASWWLANAEHIAANWGNLTGEMSHSLRAVIQSLLFPVVLAVIAAVVVSITHAGVVLSAFPLKPDFSRLNPAQGLKKIFSRKTLIESGKLFLKLLAFTIAGYQLLLMLNVELADVQTLAPLELSGRWYRHAVTIAIVLIAVMALAAILDLWLSKREFARQMRMSRRDLKDEHKRREGDPEIRSKRKRAQLELIKKVIALGKVASADVIVTNPTHYAVALQYRPSRMAVPEVIAAGRGLIAWRIIAAARRARIPIMRKPPVARKLFAEGRIGQAIPNDCESAVAEIYRWVIAIPGNKVMSS